MTSNASDNASSESAHAGSAVNQQVQGSHGSEIIESEHLALVCRDYWHALLTGERPWQFADWMVKGEGQPGYTFGDWKENAMPSYQKNYGLISMGQTSGCFAADFGYIPKYIRQGQSTWQEFLYQKQRAITHSVNEQSRARDYKNPDLDDEFYPGPSNSFSNSAQLPSSQQPPFSILPDTGAVASAQNDFPASVMTRNGNST
jgi:hypothetical protein